MTDDVGPQNWASLRTSIGGAQFVPEVIDRVVHAGSPEEATTAYWELDNVVVVQGQLFDSAVPTSRLLVRSICGQDYTASGLPRALDLLVELAYGESDQSEVERGNGGLGSQCRRTISSGLFLSQGPSGTRRRESRPWGAGSGRSPGHRPGIACEVLRCAPTPWLVQQPTSKG